VTWSFSLGCKPPQRAVISRSQSPGFRFTPRSASPAKDYANVRGKPPAPGTARILHAQAELCQHCPTHMNVIWFRKADGNSYRLWPLVLSSSGSVPCASSEGGCRFVRTVFRALLCFSILTNFWSSLDTCRRKPSCQ